CFHPSHLPSFPTRRSSDLPSTIPTDSPEARRYNRIKRWLGIADFVLGLILLFALLVTGWSGTLRDLAYSGGFQNYTLAVFLYVRSEEHTSELQSPCNLVCR